MLILAGCLLSFCLAWLMARHVVLGRRFYPEWRARRQAEGRMAGYPAFLMLYGNALFDGGGFLELHHPRNWRMLFIGAVVYSVFVILFVLFFWMLAAGVTSFGTK